MTRRVSILIQHQGKAERDLCYELMQSALRSVSRVETSEIRFFLLGVDSRTLGERFRPSFPERIWGD